MAQLELDYRSARKKLPAEIEESKKRCWQRICKEVDEDQWGLGYKIVTRHLKKGRTGGIPLQEMMDRCRVLFPVHENIVWTWPEGGEVVQITEEEIIAAGKKIRANKAPGPDCIPGEVIKLATSDQPELLGNIFSLLQTAHSQPSGK